jgi:esterase/lipase superfamily enzyme
MTLSPRSALFLALALLLGGCAGRAHGVMSATTPLVPGASKVEMLVATTRDVQNPPQGDLFTGERGAHMSFADIAISIPNDSVRQIGEVQFPQSLPPDPTREFATLSATSLNAEAALGLLNHRLTTTPRRQVLVFVHGYNTRFDDAVYRLAQFVHDSGTTALPVLFTWPSRGKTAAYGYDRESTNYSRDQLEKVLEALDRDKSVGEISVLAHSMGNWVALEALRQMAIRNGRIAPKIRNVILAAPDVDYDVFLRQVREMKTPPSLFTVFVSKDDEALGVSRRLWGDRPRLGAIDPESEPFKTELADAHILAVDITNNKSDDPVNHSKFARSPDVVRDIGRRLASPGQMLAEQRSGLGDKVGAVAAGAAATVGSAASVAVSAPFAIVDPNTRENMGDQLERLGGHVGDTVGY